MVKIYLLNYMQFKFALEFCLLHIKNYEILFDVYSFIKNLLQKHNDANSQVVNMDES